MTADETPAAPAEDRGQEQATQQAQEHERAQQQNEYSRLRLAAGIVGRTWLWFLAGCLLVTVVPMLFGWRPYVIESGSMSPRIKVGDIVLSAPAPESATARDLVGRVIVFDDPNIPGRVVTHRVAKALPDDTMRTKGDANPQLDSQPIHRTSVRGMGRLLVRYAGLPYIWMQTDNWGALVLFALSVLLAARWVARDGDVDADHPVVGGPPTDDDPPRAATGADAEPVDPTTRPARPRPARPGRSRRPTEPTRPTVARRLAGRSAVVLGLGLLLALSTTSAAFSATSRNVGNRWTVPTYSYTTEAVALGPDIYYKLDNASGANVTDSSGNAFTGTYNGTGTNFTYGVPGALVDQSPNLAVTQKNNNACIFTPATASEPASGPTTYSEIVWFKVAAGYALGGKLVGFENQRTTTVSTQYDRHIYMDGNGKLVFGVWITSTGVPKSITTTPSYNDGGWHMAVSTMGAAGMRLYVDGVLQASDANTVSETFNATGYWRFGCGNLSGWGAAANWSGPNAPSASQNYALQGSLDEVAVYPSQLSAANVAFLYFIR